MTRTRNRQRRSVVQGLSQHPMQQYQVAIKPLELATEDALEAVHAASLQVLSRHGIAFELAEARRLLQQAGAHVGADDAIVRFDPEMLLEYVALAPATFKLTGSDPDRALIFGGRYINFSTVSSPPNSTDLAGGRRAGNFADFCNFLKLAQQINVAQTIPGYPVEPTDIPVAVRHLRATDALLQMTDRPFRVYSHSRERTRDVLQMVRLARGLDDAGLIAQPSVFASINPNSPRKYDASMLWGIIECARVGQPIIITPFTLAGAMAPVSLAGALVLQNAEALAGIAFAQICRRGTPVMYGSFTSNIDMKSGAPAFGTPEFSKSTVISGQLARRYGLPYRSSNANASNALDAQAVYESQMALWAGVLSRSNFIYHGLGWLEGGLTASFEKFIVDAEMIQALMEFVKPIDFSADELALDAIGRVAPGGHFLGSEHTMARYQSAFYTPFLSDWRNFESWQEAGAEHAEQRAERIYRALLDSYTAPQMAVDRREALAAFVARREAQGGAPL